MTPQSLWFTYNRSDQVLINAGKWDPVRGIYFDHTQGSGYTYAIGTDFRDTETMYLGDGRKIIPRLSYYPDGQVQGDVHDSGNDSWGYDKAYRVTHYHQMLQGYQTTLDTLYDTTAQTPGNGWVKQTVQTNSSPSLSTTTTCTLGPFSPMGTVQGQTVTTSDDIRDVLTNYYIYFDVPQLLSRGGTRYQAGKSSPYTSATYVYNADGLPLSLLGTVSGDQSMTVGIDQQIIQTSWERNTEQQIFSMTNSVFYDGLGDVLGTMNYWWRRNKRDGVWQAPQDGAEFNLAVFPQSVSLNNDPPVPAEYTVVAGDSFETISRRFYKTPQYALWIATSNGYAVGSTPEPDDKLTLPQKLNSENKWDMSVPYHQVMSTLILSAYPNMILPPPPQPHENFFEQVATVLAVAAVAFAVPEILGPASSVLGLLAESSITAGIQTLVAKGLAAGFGVKPDLSLSDIGQSMISGALTGHAGTLSSAGQELVIEAIGPMGLQLSEMARGKRKHLDFAAITATAFANVINASARNLPTMASTAIQTVTNTLAQSVETHTPPDITGLTATLLGNAVVEAGFSIYTQQRLAEQRTLAQARDLGHITGEMGIASMQADVANNEQTDRRATSLGHLAGASLSRSIQPKKQPSTWQQFDANSVVPVIAKPIYEQPLALEAAGALMSVMPGPLGVILKTASDYVRDPAAVTSTAKEWVVQEEQRESKWAEMNALMQEVSKPISLLSPNLAMGNDAPQPTGGLYSRFAAIGQFAQDLQGAIAGDDSSGTRIARRMQAVGNNITEEMNQVALGSTWEKIKFVGSVGFSSLGGMRRVLSAISKVDGLSSVDVGMQNAGEETLRQRVLTNIAQSKIARDSSGFWEFAQKSTAIETYLQNGFGIDAALDHMKGIDFLKPIDVVTLPKGTEVVQYTYPKQLQPGNYYAPIGTPGNMLGIYTSGRTPVGFFATQDISVLRSTTAPMVDNYSMAQYGWKIETEGGATQYFSTSTAWERKP